MTSQENSTKDLSVAKKAYIIAYPAGHSLSPTMQNAAFKHLGINAHYEALETPPDKLPSTIESLRSDNVYGANVTIPHKQAVLPLVNELTEEAQNIGAVNTIINRKGYLVGYNTDAKGFLRALQEAANFNPQGCKVMMLGAGGAARAILYALLTARVKQVSIYNRTVDKANQLANDFDHLGKIKVVNQNQLSQTVKQATLLVNTTSVGMEHNGIDPQISPLPQGVLPQKGLVCDIIYKPAETRLLLEAEQAGLKTQNGLAMLVYQGAESFYTWVNKPAPVSIMFASFS